MPSADTRLKILLLRVRLLYPLNVGSKIRTAKLVEELSKQHDVTMVAYKFPDETDEDIRDTAQFCRQLIVLPFAEAPKHSLRFYRELAGNLFDSRPYMISKYASPQMAKAVAECYNGLEPDLVICDFPHACEGLNDLKKDVPFVLFQHNVEAAIFAQLAQRARNPLARLYLSLQTRKMRAYEKTQCLRARRVIAVSEVDRDAYARDYGVHHCDVVPTGVDVDYFFPSYGCEKPDSLVFTGSMDWLANQDAMFYFCQQILPRIRATRPGVTFTIVGRNPSPAIRKLAEASGVEVTGTVPDVRPFVRGAQVYVVPLRIGSGTRLKLVEAMALGKPIVCTSLGAEGLPVENGSNMILADDPDSFARAILALLQDPARCQEMGRYARAWAEENHAWPQVGRIFGDFCLHAASQRV